MGIGQDFSVIAQASAIERCPLMEVPLYSITILYCTLLECSHSNRVALLVHVV